MSSYRRILYHLVFSTKYRRPTLSLESNRELYAYISGVIRNKNCFLYRINGMEDHIHILCEVHPSISLGDFMREIKVSTSIWLKQNRNFPFFEGWAVGYGAFTYSYKDRGKIINYIKNQQEHHRGRSYEKELLSLLEEQGVKPDMRYFP